MATHEVTNQVPPLADYDALCADVALAAGVERIGGAATIASLRELGALVGDPTTQRWATEANAYPPVLRTHDRFGHRIDEVDFHPSWHALMTVAVGQGLHAAPW